MDSTTQPAKDIQGAWQKTPVPDEYLFDVEHAIEVLQALGYDVLREVGEDV